MRKMKDSGIDWIGQIPQDWNVGKTKDIFIRVNEKAREEKPVVLSLARSGVKIRDISTGEGQLAESYNNYNPVKINDLLLNPMDLYSGANCSVSKVEGVISPAYINLRTKGDNNSSYYDYYFKTQYWAMALFAHGKGVSFDNRWTLGLEAAMNYFVPIPNEEEQIKIANFLDEKVTEIDKVIEKTKETIEEYKKYKQSVITETVTKGLEKNVEMKIIEKNNLKQIPQNWQFKPLKYNVILNANSLSEKTADNYEFKYVEIGAVNLVNGITEYQKCIFKTAPSRARRLVKNGDIIVSTVRTYLKAVAIITDDKDTVVSTGFAVLQPYLINKEYLGWVIKSDYFTDMVSAWSNGISYPAINASDLINFKIPIPNKEIQGNIANYLNKKCNEIDRLIKSKEKIIEEFEQYKKSLIYEYVTGKKEVKENNSLIQDNSNEIKINCKDDIFAQAILLCKIIEKLSKYNLGRVKAEKTLYLIEKDIGFNFNNNYVREAAGPLSEAIYKCESVISKKNKWIKVNKVKKHIEYEILSNFSNYNKYYNKYYSDYDKKIERIIKIIKDYSMDKAEMVATLYASWNDFIIKEEEISDIKIVKDVRENWNDTKKRFKENEWLDVLKEMKQVGLIPKGKGNLTIIKEQ